MSSKRKLTLLLLGVLLGVLVGLCLAVLVAWGWFVALAPIGPVEFGKQVQASMNPETLRDWAIRHLESKQIRPGNQIPGTELPPALVALGTKGGGIGPFGDHRSDHVRVYWGYSFGHGYGILIGRTNLMMPTNRTCIKWVPGIYFIDP